MRVEGVDYLDGPIVVNSMEGFKEELGTESFAISYSGFYPSDLTLQVKEWLDH